jgi:hypothetical protein
MNTLLLQKSLKMIAAFPDQPNMFGRPEDYMELHSRNLSELYDYVEKNQDDFLYQVVKEIPPITVHDIAAFIEDQNSDKSWMQVIYSSYLFGAFKFFKWVKARGQSNEVIEHKVRTISSKNNSILMILKNS